MGASHVGLPRHVRAEEVASTVELSARKAGAAAFIAHVPAARQEHAAGKRTTPLPHARKDDHPKAVGLAQSCGKACRSLVADSRVRGRADDLVTR